MLRTDIDIINFLKNDVEQGEIIELPFNIEFVDKSKRAEAENEIVDLLNQNEISCIHVKWEEDESATYDEIKDKVYNFYTRVYTLKTLYIDLIDENSLRKLPALIELKEHIADEFESPVTFNISLDFPQQGEIYYLDTDVLEFLQEIQPGANVSMPLVMSVDNLELERQVQESIIQTLEDKNVQTIVLDFNSNILFPYSALRYLIDSIIYKAISVKRLIVPLDNPHAMQHLGQLVRLRDEYKAEHAAAIKNTSDNARSAQVPFTIYLKKPTLEMEDNTSNDTKLIEQALQKASDSPPNTPMLLPSEVLEGISTHARTLSELFRLKKPSKVKLEWQATGEIPAKYIRAFLHIVSEAGVPQVDLHLVSDGAPRENARNKDKAIRNLRAVSEKRLTVNTLWVKPLFESNQSARPLQGKANKPKRSKSPLPMVKPYQPDKDSIALQQALHAEIDRTLCGLSEREDDATWRRRSI